MTVTQQDKKWLEEFIVELRLRDVRGTAIGDAVATVEGHCADSGERAEAAFGNARDYARSLELPARPLGRRELVRVTGFGFMTIAGIFLVMSAGPPALEGDNIPVMLSAVVVLLGFLLLFTLVMARLEWIVRAPLWKASLTGGVAFVALVGLAVALHGIEFGTESALPFAIGGLVLMLVPPICQQFFDRSAGDGLIDPRRDEAPQRRLDRMQNALISWGFPLGVVLYVLVKWLIIR